jgi:putative transposase
MEKYKGKYRIPAARLKDWDYGSNGLYFITICTHSHIPFFGHIPKHSSSLQATEIGSKAAEFWQEIPSHYSFIELDEFVVMPNHIHGILFINRTDSHEWKSNTFGPQSANLSAVIRGYKSSLKRYANLNQIDFQWQPRYHDHIIRTDKSLQHIREYIINNPANWHQDRYHPPPP